MQPNTSPIYTESHRVLPKGMVWILLIASLVVLEIPLLAPWESWTLQEIRPNGGAVAFMALVWWFALGARIRLRLDAAGLRYQFWFLPAKKVSWQALKGWYVREVVTVEEFGGWGVLRSSKRGWGYVSTAAWGLQLVFADGRRVLISTQEPEALRRWLEAQAPPLSEFEIRLLARGQKV
ncbi:hypothetical protein [Cesiribacter andamanensis]|uniref:Bacterial Pleckstrin homology domain-containing protein n=1 Tax=Cesiribacter andamanensis AMV16 TaxID=1279009 RepID=M7NUA2_9BACT|nr:hypothetical protein [Cesiribacter andamanensis]EMR02069.1 hypothetical protein ADICEAN_02815 [Cesiribacter andamanensis AMV16]